MPQVEGLPARHDRPRQRHPRADTQPSGLPVPDPADSDPTDADSINLRGGVMRHPAPEPRMPDVRKRRLKP